MKAFHEVRNYDSDFMVWQSCYEDISFLAHWHQELELVYVHSGEARFCINNEEFTARAGDLVLIDSGDLHYSNSYDYKNRLDFILFDPGIISSRYHSLHLAHPLVSAAMLQQYGLTEKTQQLFTGISRELGERGPFYQEIVSAMLREFIYRLRRCLPTADPSSAAQNSRSEMRYDMQQLLTYIDEHYGENITLAFAARQMNFSESYFSKKFKKLTGLNFITYLNTVRVEQAAELLKHSGARISDIALSCGFGNVRSFNRTFKEYTGHTPSEFLNLPGSDIQHYSYYKRKSPQTHYVRDDSMTLVKNSSLEPHNFPA
jgi:AraC-like DNA-binding protein